jgi:hypothetical protein
MPADRTFRRPLRSATLSQVASLKPSLWPTAAKQYPQNTLIQFNYLPAVRAQIALNSGNADRALDLLKPTRGYELGQPAQALLLNMYPVFVRGSAYLAVHDGPAARAEYQEILENPGIALNEPIAVLARLGLARADALAGDKQKARSDYEDFFTLRKDADANVPLLKQAKGEYARLQ